MVCAGVWCVCVCVSVWKELGGCVDGQVDGQRCGQRCVRWVGEYGMRVEVCSAGWMGVSVPQYEHGVVARLRLTHGEERDDHLVSKPVVVSSRKSEVRS